MKRRIWVILVAVVLGILITTGTAGTALGAGFPDVQEGAWYWGVVTKLVELGSIAGYPDGNFVPGGTITRAEFTKVLVFSALGPAYANPGEHWAAGVIRKAQERQLIQADEFPEGSWDTPILRQEMARLLARTLEYVREETRTLGIDTYSAYTEKIADWAAISDGYKAPVAVAYAAGLIAGMPDGSFAGEQTATRAEAAAMMVRLLDPDQRVRHADLINTEIHAFDPATDLNADGELTITAAEPYLMALLESMAFYQEDGRYYVKGTMPVLPAGFETRLSIDVGFKTAVNGSYFWGADTVIINPAVGQKQIPQTGSFNFEIETLKMDNLEDASVGMRIKNIGDADSADGSFVLYYSKPDVLAINKNNDGGWESTGHRRVYYDFSKLFQW
jgi:hypothetical protein